MTRKKIMTSSTKKSRPIKCFRANLFGTCGVGLYYGFDYNSPAWALTINDTRAFVPGGAGWAIAGFVNTPICKKAYGQLAEKHKIIYQSPVRYNDNSGRQFFFCVYDTRKT